MMTWSEKIRLSQPLREARLAAHPHDMQVERRIQERERAAHERGRQAGEKALGEQLVRQRKEITEIQNGVLQSLRQAIPRTIRECENAMVDLALEVARRLVAGLPISAELVEAAVREAIADVEQTSGLEIRIHPEDLTLLQAGGSSLIQAGPGVDSLRFVPVPDVPRGGCLVHTRFGIIDACPDTKFEKLKTALQE